MSETTVAFLSDRYFELFHAKADDLPTIDRAKVCVQYLVDGAPEGPVRYLLDIQRGRVNAIGRGEAPAPDLRIGVGYADLVELNTGGQHVASALMQGVLRVDGDKAKLLDLMLTVQTGGYQRLLAELGELTEFTPPPSARHPAGVAPE